MARHYDRRCHLQNFPQRPFKPTTGPVTHHSTAIFSGDHKSNAQKRRIPPLATNPPALLDRNLKCLNNAARQNNLTACLGDFLKIFSFFEGFKIGRQNITRPKNLPPSPRSQLSTFRRKDATYPWPDDGKSHYDHPALPCGTESHGGVYGPKR